MKEIKPNYFVRSLIVALSMGISCLIGYNFFKTEPAGKISAELITLLLILVLLVLSESFDNFSIGKLISVNRKLEEKKKDNEKLEKKNYELLSQLIQVSNTQKPIAKSH